MVVTCFAVFSFLNAVSGNLTADGQQWQQVRIGQPHHCRTNRLR